MESGPVHGVQKVSHCAWQIHYPVVFPVKYRKALLDDEVVQIITETAQAISERYDMEFERIGCDGDHIHLLCTAPPRAMGAAATARLRRRRVFAMIGHIPDDQARACSSHRTSRAGRLGSRLPR
ncbi:MAG: IS200/IS605 family transposase [Burkholderia gladioli]